MEQRSTFSSTTTLTYLKNTQSQVDPQPQPFTQTFTSPDISGPRNVYLKTVLRGSFFTLITLFAAFSIFWGALYKTPVRNLEGWVVDFDDALIGHTVTQALITPSPQSAAESKITWTPVSASQFPGGLRQLIGEVTSQKVWVVVVVNANATARLLDSYSTPDRAYNGSQAITVYTVEARNENAFRVITRPSVQAQLTTIANDFELQAISKLLANRDISPPLDMLNILETSPQTILAPVGYTVDNLVPYDHSVAAAVTFVGMMFQLITSFFISMMGYSARDISGLHTRLTLRSLLIVRFVTAIVTYFFVSLCYALLNLAFQLDFTRTFGRAGFMVFWMMNWAGMLGVGLALESMITLLTPRFISFFMITWIIVNASAIMLPLEVLPIVYHYGYAVPFYNISHATRCILFGTRNTVGMNIGILLSWGAVSSITLPFFQWLVRRKAVRISRTIGVVNRPGDVVNVVMESRKDFCEMEQSIQPHDIRLIEEERERYIDEGRVDPVSTVSIQTRNKEQWVIE